MDWPSRSLAVWGKLFSTEVSLDQLGHCCNPIHCTRGNGFFMRILRLPWLASVVPRRATGPSLETNVLGLSNIFVPTLATLCLDCCKHIPHGDDSEGHSDTSTSAMRIWPAKVWQHMPPLCQLHWLLLFFQVQFKVLVWALKSLTPWDQTACRTISRRMKPTTPWYQCLIIIQLK